MVSLLKTTRERMNLEIKCFGFYIPFFGHFCGEDLPERDMVMICIFYYYFSNLLIVK